MINDKVIKTLNYHKELMIKFKDEPHNNKHYVTSQEIVLRCTTIIRLNKWASKEKLKLDSINYSIL